MSIPNPREQPELRKIIEQIGDDDEYIEYFNYLLANRAESTYNNHKTTIKQLNNFIEKPAYEVETAELARWKDAMLNAENKPRTVQSKIYIISAFCQLLIERGYRDDNPVRGVMDLNKLNTSQKEIKSDQEFLSVDEYKSIEEACDSIRDKLIIQLLWTTGVRPSELVSITLDDVFLDENRIKIENAKSGKFEEKGERNVFFNKSTKVTLDKWINKGYRKGYYFADESDRLILSQELTKMEPKRVSIIVDKYAEKAGVQKTLYEDTIGRPRKWITPTLFRHSFASHAVKNGIPFVYLQELMGHDDFNTTRENYIHLREEDTSEIAEKYTL